MIHPKLAPILEQLAEADREIVRLVQQSEEYQAELVYKIAQLFNQDKPESNRINPSDLIVSDIGSCPTSLIERCIHVDGGVCLFCGNRVGKRYLDDAPTRVTGGYTE